MNEKPQYQPRLMHAVLLVLLASGIILYAAQNLDDAGLTVGLIAGGLFYLGSFMVMAWLTNRERIAFYDAVSRLADRLSSLDADQWQALGIAFPSLRIHWSGRPIQFVEDSNFTVDEFRRFMGDSNYRQISPMRNWNNGRDRRTWERIKNWLEAKGYIQHYSAAGNHSWLWKGNTFHHLRMRYLGEDPIPELDSDGYTAPAAVEEGATS
jgi:hypothetical protein